MEKNTAIMIRVMINRYHKESPTSLLNCLPENDRQEVLDQNIQSDDAEASLDKPEKILEKIHYSWIEQYLQKQPPSLLPYFLEALPYLQKKGLSQVYQQNAYLTQKLSPPIQSFLLSFLSKSMGLHETTPAAYLSENPLSPLINFTKEEWIQLIDLLGIYDLANEVRLIIDKQHLQHLYQCLSKKQKQYLRKVLYIQEKFTQERLGIEQFRGSQKVLDRILHRRGLIRLSKALSGSDPDFLWHVTRTLDTGRAAILERYISKKEIPVITSALIQQVLHAYRFLQSEDKEIE